MNDASAETRGLTAGIAAFAIWGLLPLYLLPLAEVGAATIIAHRLLWGCAFTLLWLAWRGQLAGVTATLRNPRLLGRLAGTALLVSINWLVYVWAVGNGHVLDGSLGYFINPLVNVMFGVALLSERLNGRQWTAVGIAAAGVLWLTLLTGRLPWIALVLAVTFSAYGLLRKITPVDSVTGLAVETLLLTPFGLAWIVWQGVQGPGAMGGQGAGIGLWLVLGGVVTALPLALFAFAAQRIAYSTLGLVQYLGPTLQLFCGVLVFHEPLPLERLAGFAMIWLALLIYAGDGFWRARRAQAAASRAAVCAS